MNESHGSSENEVASEQGAVGIRNADLVRDSITAWPGWNSPGRDRAEELQRYSTTDDGECVLAGHFGDDAVWRVLDRFLADEDMSQGDASALIGALQVVSSPYLRSCLTGMLVELGELLALASKEGAEQRTARLAMVIRHELLYRMELNSTQETIVLDLAIDSLQHALDCSREARLSEDDYQRRIAFLQASRQEKGAFLKAFAILDDLRRARMRDEAEEQETE